MSKFLKFFTKQQQRDLVNDLFGYKEYVALLTQTGTAAPVATVLNSKSPNFLDDVVWSRGTGGPYMWYIATKASGTWDNTKMVILIGNGTKISPSDEVTLVVTETSNTTIQFKPVLVKTPEADPYSDITNGRHPVSVTIRVYN